MSANAETLPRKCGALLLPTVQRCCGPCAAMDSIGRPFWILWSAALFARWQYRRYLRNGLGIVRLFIGTGHGKDYPGREDCQGQEKCHESHDFHGNCLPSSWFVARGLGGGLPIVRLLVASVPPDGGFACCRNFDGRNAPRRSFLHTAHTTPSRLMSLLL